MKVCDKCGASLIDEAKFCNKCGAMVLAICPNCGKDNDSASVYCLYCGARLKKEEDTNNDQGSSFDRDANLNDPGPGSKSDQANNQKTTDANGETPVIEKVSMFTAYQKFAVFSGRATRKEFWLWVLFNFLVGLAIGFLIHDSGVADTLLSLFSFINIIPGLAVTVRRLHDIGKSGLYFLLVFIPLVNLVLLIFELRASEPRSNEYGPYTIAE